MKLSFVEPRVELRPYIRTIWVFESPVGLPSSDISLAAPNGCAKLIVNCENSLVTRVMGHDDESQEQSLYFIGIRSVPVFLSSTPKKTCFIGIEFHPSGAYPILGIPMVELTDRRLLADDLSGTWNRSLTEMLRNREGIVEKIDFIQDRLWRSLKQAQNKIVAYCVDYLKRTQGYATIRDLERETGYERRHLERLFSKNVGMSPKKLAEIFRFQKFYKELATASLDSLKEDVHDYFYDDAHFNKAFKKMSGFPPKYYSLKIPNRFGRLLSQD
jgi:AraC-like DNA-binding protein